MKRATSVLRQVDMAGREISDSVTLKRDGRYRRRIGLASDGGLEFLLDLAEATYLHPGDGLLLDDGTVIVVKAAREDLLQVTAASELERLQIAWHLGNRHTAAEITLEAIYIEYDHVLAQMLEGLGATVLRVERAFEPEGGAYGGHGALQRSHHHHGAG